MTQFGFRMRLEGSPTLLLLPTTIIFQRLRVSTLYTYYGLMQSRLIERELAVTEQPSKFSGGISGLTGRASRLPDCPILGVRDQEVGAL